METLYGIILSTVKHNVEAQLLRELDNRHYYTGHSLVIKDVNDVKTAIHAYAMNEMDTASRRLYLLMGN